MERSEFGIRLKQAFFPLKNKEIAGKLGVVPSAVQNYLGGRMPDGATLLKITRLTGCDLHWLLTGENSQGVNHKQNEPISLDSVFEKHVNESVIQTAVDVLEKNMGSGLLVGAKAEPS